MIENFSCRDTEKIWDGKYVKRFPANIQERALGKLRLVDAAQVLDDLKNPPGNRLEVLKGDRSGQMSIRINQRWRICFRWEEGKALNVHIVDYH
ncbi:MAG: type II toxin-antitoxin system RelE/ParE family toxin [Saprospiraceae bacterium]|nr:type II toxin-antitoxin system RelE/ParE family toxin [Saprospiraceae bacterium]